MDSDDRSPGTVERDTAPKKPKKKAAKDGEVEQDDEGKVGENEKEKRAGKEAADGKAKIAGKEADAVAGQEPKRRTEAGFEDNSSQKKISKKNRNEEDRVNGSGSEGEEKEGKSVENNEKEEPDGGEKRGNGNKRNAKNQRKNQSSGEAGKAQ